MRSRSGSFLVVFFLVLAGVGAVSLRLYRLKQVRLGDDNGWWRLTYQVEVDVGSEGAKIQVAVPTDKHHARVFRENLSYGDLQAERSTQLSGTSLVSFSTQEKGLHFITAQFDLEVSRNDRSTQFSSRASSLQTTERFLRSTPTIQTQSVAVQDTLKRLQTSRELSVDPVLQIFEYCVTRIEDDVEDESSSDAASVLNYLIGGNLGRAKAMVALCRADGIPARVVTGFEVDDQPELKPRSWVETLRNRVWESHDLQGIHFGFVPENFLPIRYDGDRIVFVKGQEHCETLFSSSKLSPKSALHTTENNPLEIMDLTRLPMSMHPILSVILLIPLGALVTALFQVMIGLRTIGTFSPTLIALSFVMADWRTGVAIFALVIALGLISRAMIDRLKLLMVPKLSFMLTLVVVTLVFTISVLDYLRLTPSPQAVLLPMVILTMTIERFYVTTAEEGLTSALHLLLNTVLVSFVCFVTLGWRQVGQIVITFPEVHFFTLAAIVFLGSYNGYRLAELWRFRDLRPSSTDASLI